MDVVLHIQGRKALPIWVLPYVTSWKLSPAELLERLENPKYDFSISFPIAFNLDTNNESSLVPPEQWIGPAVQIKSLDATLKNGENATIQSYDECRNSSVNILRKYRAYVWLDEFQKWFDRQTYACEQFDLDDDNQTIKKPGLKLCLSPLLDNECAQYLEAEKTEIDNRHNKRRYKKIDESKNSECETTFKVYGNHRGYTDERLKYGGSFGETVSLDNLRKRWKVNKRLIDELCFAKKIRPNNSLGEGFPNVIDGKEVFVFAGTP